MRSTKPSTSCGRRPASARRRRPRRRLPPRSRTIRRTAATAAHPSTSAGAPTRDRRRRRHRRRPAATRRRAAVPDGAPRWSRPLPLATAVGLLRRRPRRRGDAEIVEPAPRQLDGSVERPPHGRVESGVVEPASPVANDRPARRSAAWSPGRQRADLRRRAVPALADGEHDEWIDRDRRRDRRGDEVPGARPAGASFLHEHPVERRRPAPRDLHPARRASAGRTPPPTSIATLVANASSLWARSPGSSRSSAPAVGPAASRSSAGPKTSASSAATSPTRGTVSGGDRPGRPGSRTSRRDGAATPRCPRHTAAAEHVAHGTSWPRGGRRASPAWPGRERPGPSPRARAALAARGRR